MLHDRGFERGSPLGLGDLGRPGLRVAGDGVAGQPRTERERHRRRGEDREHDEPTDDEHAMTARRLRPIGRRPGLRPLARIARTVIAARAV